MSTQSIFKSVVNIVSGVSLKFQNFVLDSLNTKKSTHIQRVSGHEFSIAHYTGKLTYDARDLADKNRDFLPPEMVISSILQIYIQLKYRCHTTG